MIMLQMCVLFISYFYYTLWTSNRSTNSKLGCRYFNRIYFFKFLNSLGFEEKSNKNKKKPIDIKLNIHFPIPTYGTEFTNFMF